MILKIVTTHLYCDDFSCQNRLTSLFAVALCSDCKQLFYRKKVLTRYCNCGKMRTKRNNVVAIQSRNKKAPRGRNSGGFRLIYTKSGNVRLFVGLTSCSATCRRDIKSHLLQQNLREILCNIALSIPPLYLQYKIFIVHLKNY